MSISLVIISSEQAPIFRGQILFNGNWMPIDAKAEAFLFSLLDIVYANLTKQIRQTKQDRSEKQEKQDKQAVVDCLMPRLAEIHGYVAHAYVMVDRSIITILVPVEMKHNTAQLKTFFLAAEALHAAESMNAFYRQATHVMDDSFCFLLGREIDRCLLGRR